ncbi:hypothetical protein HELRODRAFT_171692 [Helobdella robusta]|uniref:Uncharacterized protein n=1 Tax=Helobdella robusta TaxID=6412 RepID=T1F4K2_HELRO|nr:hypothetical protein HELRODRAFT_171692 [Helobdella robusta]ESO05322.1 hypothetical protein HELRODRAFT_171692 [Helobdella robusta]
MMKPRSQEIILDCFFQPDHKSRAEEILNIIKVTTKDLLPAGGHAISSPFGSVLNQSAPLNPTLYSSIYMDCYNRPLEQERCCIPYLGISVGSKPPHYTDPCCSQGKISHSSRKNEVNCCPAAECPAKRPLYCHYPSGAAPLGHHHPMERIGFDESLTKNKLNC